jgi:hypothetical protein
MKEKEELQNISARVPHTDWMEVNRIAEKRKMSQSQVLRMLVGVGLECHKDMENLGLIGVIDMVYYVKQAMKAKASGKQMVLPI